MELMTFTSTHLVSKATRQLHVEGGVKSQPGCRLPKRDRRARNHCLGCSADTIYLRDAADDITEIF